MSEFKRITVFGEVRNGGEEEAGGLYLLIGAALAAFSLA